MMGPKKDRWLNRYPLLIPCLAVAGFLGIFQAFFLLGRFRSISGELEIALGLAKFGFVVGLVTTLLLVPIAFLIRRWHPAWRRGERHQASWAVCFGLVASVTGWMLADFWVSGPLVAEALRPWVAGLAAIACGLAASWVRPPVRWVRIGAAITLLVLVLSFVPVGEGYRPKTPAPETSVPAPPDAGQPDVILVSIDTLRADRLGAYGSTPSLTPEIDRLANEGVTFARALAASPWTIPSVASMLTGLSTLSHGAGWPLGSGPTYERSVLDDRFTTLAERFAAAGYRTRAVVANGFLAPWTGMTQGFEEFVNPFTMASFSGVMRELPLTRLIVTLMPPGTWSDYRASGVTDQALAWLDQEDRAPLFLWVHYIDPHSPFQADPATLDLNAVIEMADQQQPEVLDDGTVIGETFVATDLVRSGSVWLGPRDRERLEDYYDRAVRYTDEHVGRLFATLRQRPRARPVVAVLTSDHGEEFWDHGHFEHGHDYFREVTQIPLVFWGPGVVPSGLVVSDLVGLIDVAPTLAALAGLGPTEIQVEIEGRSIESLWQDKLEAESLPSQPQFSEGNLYGLPAVLVEDGPWRFVLRANDREELYDVTRDPGERYNVALEFPEIAQHYRRLVEPRLAAFLAGNTDQEPKDLSPEELRALKALGYVD